MGENCLRKPCIIAIKVVVSRHGDHHRFLGCQLRAENTAVIAAVQTQQGRLAKLLHLWPQRKPPAVVVFYPVLEMKLQFRPDPWSNQGCQGNAPL